MAIVNDRCTECGVRFASRWDEHLRTCPSIQPPAKPAEPSIDAVRVAHHHARIARQLVDQPGTERDVRMHLDAILVTLGPAARSEDETQKTRTG